MIEYTGPRWEKSDWRLRRCGDLPVCLWPKTNYSGRNDGDYVSIPWVALFLVAEFQLDFV